MRKRIRNREREKQREREKERKKERKRRGEVSFFPRHRGVVAALVLSFSIKKRKKKLSTRHQVRPARLEQLEHLVQRRHVQDVLHAAPSGPSRAALQRDDRPDLDLVVGVDENQVFGVKDADDVLAVALPDGDARVAF